MAAPAASPRRTNRATPGRNPRPLASIEPATEPPQKRRKFLPGGPGGGGRYVDEDGNEMPRELVMREPRTAPRNRSRREPVEGSARPENTDANTPLVTRSAMQTRPRRERPERYAPQPSTPRPRYSSAAAAAAASQASDGYKPREERGWEEFHPDLDLDADLFLFTADEVDGRTSRNDPKLQKLNIRGLEPRSLDNSDVEMKDVTTDVVPTEALPSPAAATTPLRRKPGRPPRRPESMLSGLGSPPAPRIIPLPTHNPKERLNLPKPSFRHYNHFLQYEEDQKENKVNYVDRTMAHVGFQESDRFELPSKVLVRLSEGQQIEDDAEVSLRLESDGPAENGQAAPVVGKVEYDMDEQDVAWLEDINELRKSEGVEAIKPAIFEITMTQIEKEFHALEKRIPKPQPRHAQTHRPRSSSQAAVNGDPNPPGDEPDSKCSICDDGDCENANAIIFCDGCDLAVHQECYGVPFIPEGQWFCRKCKEIGRGTPTCIFCPNVDGAFKQTSTLRWSHLLCAIWIPEVTIANMTFMEPIQDVDKVPKSRWRLTCYICNQKMGACIQCGNKNCYQAFHVTCARRARLFLKMKSQNQGGIDTTALKAFCDKHVPQEWRRTHDTDNATQEAKRWYRHQFKDRKWADSQSAAMELGAPPPADGGIRTGENMTAEDTIAVTKRRRNLPPKQSWRLPSGAPVIPSVVYYTVEASLTRFTVRKRKEFVEKACRYWTLKREARRGAALLKRLQLQLESFSSMEVTRRNFAGMGAAGGPRLQRRVEFAEMLQKDMGYLRDLTAKVRQREELRMREVELLRELVDTVYFPIPPLLSPVLRRAMKLDEKTGYFRAGFEMLAQRLTERYYTSVSDFSRDFTLSLLRVIAPEMENPSTADIEAMYIQLNEAPPGTAQHQALTIEQKDLKKVAKRILKPVTELLEAAARKEAELRGRELEEEIRKLDSMGIFASAVSKSLDVGEEEEPEGATKRRSGSDASAVAGASPEAQPDGDTDMQDADDHTDEAVIRLNLPGTDETVPILPDKHTPASKAASYASSIPDQSMKTRSDRPAEPLSPPISRSSSAPNGAAGSTSGESSNSSAESQDVYANGGIPWYLEPFDPIGTTIHEERYTGREVLREMSEELSDMDEDTLTELKPGIDEALLGKPAPANGVTSTPASDQAAKKAKRKAKPRRQHWSSRR